MEETHIWKLNMYISVLEEKGIDGVTGEIDYPKLRQKVKLNLPFRPHQSYMDKRGCVKNYTTQNSTRCN